VLQVAEGGRHYHVVAGVVVSVCQLDHGSRLTRTRRSPPASTPGKRSR
jgi:hypothetical protein